MVNGVLNACAVLCRRRQQLNSEIYYLIMAFSQILHCILHISTLFAYSCAENRAGAQLGFHACVRFNFIAGTPIGPYTQKRAPERSTWNRLSSQFM